MTVCQAIENSASGLSVTGPARTSPLVDVLSVSLHDEYEVREPQLPRIKVLDEWWRNDCDVR